MVYTDFWNDPRVIEELTPEDKYFFLYLLTNPNTTQIGIYQITKKQMAFDIGYSMESINSLLERFINNHKLVRYSNETRELAIKNWGKYNLRRGGKPMLDCVRSELKEVKDKSLISFVGKNVEQKDIKKLYESYYVTLDATGNESDNDKGVDSEEKDKPNNINGSDDTSTLRGTYRPQYKEQEEEKEQDKEEYKEQQLLQQDIKEIIEFWDNNGFGYNNINAKEKLLSWLYDSPFKEPKEMIIKALDIATTNDARRLNYVEGILRNWKNESLLTLEEVEKRDGLHRSRSDNASSNGKGTSYEQALREAELARKSFNR